MSFPFLAVLFWFLNQAWRTYSGDGGTEAILPGWGAVEIVFGSGKGLVAE